MKSFRLSTLHWSNPHADTSIAEIQESALDFCCRSSSEYRSHLPMMCELNLKVHVPLVIVVLKIELFCTWKS